MGLKERRIAVGYSQERLAEDLGVDRKTVSRWDTGASAPQPEQRRSLANLLQVDLDELDTLIAQSKAGARRATASEPPPIGTPAAEVGDDMIRREFLRLVAITGAFARVEADADEAGADTAAVPYTAMNAHLWQVYQLARSKKAVYPLVHDQLQALSESLSNVGAQRRPEALFTAAGDLFQLSGELAFDQNRYTDAAAAYTLSASVSKETQAWDLWACALVRHAYVDVYGGNYKQAVSTLSAAERIARRGDSQMSTRHWVAAVQAEAFAGLGRLDDCERAMEAAQEVTASAAGNGGWLRFDGSRLAEERGARYVQLGRLDLAESSPQEALRQEEFAPGLSLRRRGAVLTDLASIGAKRRDVEQLVSYAHQAVDLARASSSGYIVRRLSALRAEFADLGSDRRVAELDTELRSLTAS